MYSDEDQCRKQVKLVSNDGKTIEMSMEAIKLSPFVSSLLEIQQFHQSEKEIPIPITIRQLKKVKVFCEKYVLDPVTEIKKVNGKPKKLSNLLTSFFSHYITPIFLKF
jgi:hypothetical protein